jgi:NhaP-type Na+/H+ and K+/H+ antiporter
MSRAGSSQQAQSNMALSASLRVSTPLLASELLAPKGDTALQPGDHVYVFSRTEDLPFLRLMFGQRQDE